jgi:uncharacterized membrane-anchored protein
MEVLEYRTWIMFYLITFTALLWAAFLTTQGVMLWVSLTLNIIVMGICGGFLIAEVRNHKKKRERIRQLLSDEKKEVDARQTHHIK